MQQFITPGQVLRCGDVGERGGTQNVRTPKIERERGKIERVGIESPSICIRLYRPRRFRSAHQIQARVYSTGLTVTHCMMELGRTYKHENAPN